MSRARELGWRLCAVLLGAGITGALVSSPAHAALECSGGSNHHDILTRSGVAFFFSGGDVTDLTGTLDFGDGASAAISVGGRVEHQFDRAGHFVVTIEAAGHVNVTYEDGTPGNEPCTSSGVFSVVDVHDLDAAFTSRPVGDDGRTVVFDASPSRGEQITGYEWSFGDGGRASGPSTTHRFPKPGIASAHLTVHSAYGTDSTVGRVRIPEPSEEGGPGAMPWIVAGGIGLLALGVGAWWLRARTAPIVPASPSPTPTPTPQSDHLPETVGGGGTQIVYGQERTLTDHVQDVVNQWKENIGQDKSDEVQKAMDGQLTDEDVERMQREASFGAATAGPTSTLVGEGINDQESLAAKPITNLLDWFRRTFSGPNPPPKP